MLLCCLSQLVKTSVDILGPNEDFFVPDLYLCFLLIPN